MGYKSFLSDYVTYAMVGIIQLHVIRCMGWKNVKNFQVATLIAWKPTINQGII